MKVKLLEPNRLLLWIPKVLTPSQLQSLRLNIDDEVLESLQLIQEELKGGLYQYLFERPQPLDLGHAYFLVIEGQGSFPVDVSAALDFPNFHQLYTYDHHDLGAHYSPKKTMFKVWAPLASQVLLYRYNDRRLLQQIYPMRRGDHGVYHLELLEDCQGMFYRYGITNHGVMHLTLDPYGTGSSRNSEYSVVINFASCLIPMHDQALPPLPSYEHAVIYETHVRDLTSDPKTTIPYKGTFLGAIQTNHRSPQGQPIGFDYVKATGITHLQLLPVTDYRTVNEHEVASQYNWGYDPYHFFSLEGSYASDLDDPHSRIKDFFKLVSHYHQHGIRINVDMVYNHVYDYHHSIFEKVVPGYYFRKLPNGEMSNGSFCGNDLASEKPMVRHLIVSSAEFLVSTYHLDGFRFDLMGILDIETLHEIKKRVRAIRPSFMLYGEGWNMPTHLPMTQKGISENAHILTDFAFFNDTFRNLIKGGNSTHDLHERGYATGNLGLAPYLPGLMLGSADRDLNHARFIDPNQSINYVECHDNHTFYDKLLVSNSDEGEAFFWRRIILANAIILLSAGIPFFHKSQELGGTKYGDHNSYRSGDRINQFDYRLVDDRPELVKAFQDLIRIRKHWLGQLPKHGWRKHQLAFEYFIHGAYQIRYQFLETFVVFINPSLHQIQIPEHFLSPTWTLIFDGEKSTSVPLTLTHIPPVRCLILKQK